MIRQEWRIIKSISPGGWGKSISLWRAGGDVKRVHTLCVQRLLLSSYSARLLAVRRVSQDNRGKRTPGVDGVASLTPPERFALAQDLRHLDKDPQVVRRIYIDKPGSDEKRPLGIPTLSDRARQAFVFVKPNSWANYYKTCAAKRTFNDLDTQLFWKLTKWARFRHPRKWWRWIYRRYWQRPPGKNTIEFTDGDFTLINYVHTKIERHTKVKSHQSPFDGDWTYWTARLGKDPTQPKRVCVLMKIQKGRWTECGLRLRAMDVLEIHHRDGNHNNHHYQNLALIHGHCHDSAHSSKVLLIIRPCGSNSRLAEKRCNGKLLCPVWYWQWGERPPH